MSKEVHDVHLLEPFGSFIHHQVHDITSGHPWRQREGQGAHDGLVHRPLCVSFDSRCSLQGNPVDFQVDRTGSLELEGLGDAWMHLAEHAHCLSAERYGGLTAWVEAV